MIALHFQVQFHIVCMVLALATLLHLATVEASCTFKGQEVCDGVVVKETKRIVRVCIEGKIKMKVKKKYEPQDPTECINGETCSPLTGGGSYVLFKSCIFQSAKYTCKF